MTSFCDVILTSYDVTCEKHVFKKVICSLKHVDISFLLKGTEQNLSCNANTDRSTS